MTYKEKMEETRKLLQMTDENGFPLFARIEVGGAEQWKQIAMFERDDWRMMILYHENTEVNPKFAAFYREGFEKCAEVSKDESILSADTLE